MGALGALGDHGPDIGTLAVGVDLLEVLLLSPRTETRGVSGRELLAAPVGHLQA